MQEQIRRRREAHSSGPQGQDDLFADDASVPALVTINHGPYTEQLPVANMTVGEIRTRFRDRFDIDPHSQALLDGQEVGDDTIVRPGQLLMFSRKAGEKGAVAVGRVARE